MSTHSTQLWLVTELGPGPGGGVADIGVASDIGVDQCARITIAESGGRPDGPEAQIHLNPEQAELVGRALLAIAADLRARGANPEWAGRTVELDDCGLRWLENAPPAVLSEPQTAETGSGVGRDGVGPETGSEGATDERAREDT